MAKDIKSRNSYARWKKFAEFLSGNPTDAEIMFKVHEMLDDMSAYGSITKSAYSKESLVALLEEHKCGDCRGYENDCVECYGENQTIQEGELCRL